MEQSSEKEKKQNKKKNNKLPPRRWPDPIDWRSNLYTTDLWLLGTINSFYDQPSQSSSVADMEDDTATDWLNIHDKIKCSL